MAELKPCPFCGGEAKVSLILGNYGVACTKCQGSVLNIPYQTRNQAIKAWNKRAESEELKFTRQFIHEHGLEFALASAWSRRAEDVT